MILNYEAEADGITADAVIENVLEEVRKRGEEVWKSYLATTSSQAWTVCL